MNKVRFGLFVNIVWQETQRNSIVDCNTIVRMGFGLSATDPGKSFGFGRAGFIVEYHINKITIPCTRFFRSSAL